MRTKNSKGLITLLRLMSRATEPQEKPGRQAQRNQSIVQLGALEHQGEKSYDLQGQSKGQLPCRGIIIHATIIQISANKVYCRKEGSNHQRIYK